MFFNELKQENSGGRLYIESLANVLAVHLLRQHAATEDLVSLSRQGAKLQPDFPENWTGNLQTSLHAWTSSRWFAGCLCGG